MIYFLKGILEIERLLKNGRKLNHFEIKPDKEIKSAVIFLHGYGANGKDLIEIEIFGKKLAGNNFCISKCSFQLPLGGEAFQWFELTSVAPEKIGEGLEKAGPYLNNFIDNVSEIYNLEIKKFFCWIFTRYYDGIVSSL